MAATGGWRLVVYPGAGHGFYGEEPDRFAKDLVAFIKDLWGQLRGTSGRHALAAKAASVRSLFSG